MQDTLQFVQPQLLKALIDFIYSFSTDDPQPVRNGYVISATMFLVAALQSAVLHQYFHRCFTTGMRLRAAVVTAIYQKSLRLSPAGR
jgi:ATP-binding cassette subfamily C (CFTR/MRP) protein 1